MLNAKAISSAQGLSEKQPHIPLLVRQTVRRPQVLELNRKIILICRQQSLYYIILSLKQFIFPHVWHSQLLLLRICKAEHKLYNLNQVIQPFQNVQKMITFRLKPSYIGRNERWCRHCGKQPGSCSKSQSLPYNSLIPLLGIFSRKM